MYVAPVYAEYLRLPCMLLLCTLIPEASIYVAPVYAVYLRLPRMLLLCMLYT